MSVKVRNMKFHENASSGSRDSEDGHDEANSRFSLFTLTRLKSVLPAQIVQLNSVIKSRKGHYVVSS